MKHKLLERAEIHDVEFDDVGALVVFTLGVEDEDVYKFDACSWNQSVVDDFVEDIID